MLFAMVTFTPYLNKFVLLFLFVVLTLVYMMLIRRCEDVVKSEIFELKENKRFEYEDEDYVNEEKYEPLKKYIVKNDPRKFPRIQQRGEYWVLYNYIRSSKTFQVHESITYTTHGDFTFLYNLQPLLERWLGPVSIALYAPGDDFQNTIDSIRYLRDCTSTLIEELTTFHIFFNIEHIPQKIPVIDDILKYVFDCQRKPPQLNISTNQTYKAMNKLPYPVNVARNVAKEMAQTHFVLASDIELYPSLNIIPNFLQMITNTSYIFGSNPTIFPLNLFEVEEDVQVPSTKTELLKMLDNETAVNFHKFVCPMCHMTPDYDKWVKTPETEGLNIFTVGKRYDRFKYWEPIYIGTKNDPAYDERLTWEGKSDKMSQGYILCVKDYDMKILDNAFLVHKPGIKMYKKDREREIYVKQTNALKNIILKELNLLYGSRKSCVL